MPEPLLPRTTINRVVGVPVGVGAAVRTRGSCPVTGEGAAAGGGWWAEVGEPGAGAVAEPVGRGFGPAVHHVAGGSVRGGLDGWAVELVAG